MRIGIIGAGNIGANAARLFVRAGNEVAIANSRGPETLTELVAELGERAQAATVEDAVRFGDVVLISIPFGKIMALPAAAFDGKIVIDTNNYFDRRDGSFPDLDSGATTSSELLARHLSGARVVKAFNTIWFEHLRTQGNLQLALDERRVIPIAGDDADAKAVVAGLIESIGFGPLDVGALREGRHQQPGSAIYNQVLTVEAARALLNR